MPARILKSASFIVAFGLAFAVLFHTHARDGVNRWKRNAAVEAPRLESRTSPPETLPPMLGRQIRSAYAALPLAFEQNTGQTVKGVKYVARAHGYTLFLRPDEAVFSICERSDLIDARRTAGGKGLVRVHDKRHPDARQSRAAAVYMQLNGANRAARISATDELAGKANYFIGNDPRRWRRNISLYGNVNYEDIYPGIRLAFHGEQRQLEFDFVVAPEASPKTIAFQFKGAGIKIDASGNLLISSAGGEIVVHKPIAYQQSHNRKKPVDAQFVLNADNRVSFELGEYDHQRELVIDPSVAVLYATYLGGSGADEAEAVAVDSSTGNAYVTGETSSVDFPGYSGTNKLTGSENVFVTEMNAAGSNFLYSTYVGGSDSDAAYGIAMDKSADVFVVGATNSSDFPHTSGAFQASLGSSGATNAFIFELNATGSLTYGTYFGGSASDVALGVAFDQTTGLYAIAGSASSTDFPIKNALQPKLAGSDNGFVSLWNSAGNSLTFSTYLGAATGDNVNAVALDSSDNVYVTGKTSSPAFPTTSGAFQTKCGTDGTCNGGLLDAFVTEINSTGSNYVFSTFLGGSNNDLCDGIAVDATGIYITGQTESTDFPVVAGGFQATFGGGDNDAFVTKLNSSGSAEVYSSYLGGSGAEIGASIAIDGGGNAYITGQTDSPTNNFPLVIPTQATLGGGNDAFVTEVNSSGSKLLFSTYLGGSQDEDDGGNYGAIAVDSYGANIYVAGNTASTDFPVFPNPGALQTTYGGGSTDAFVAKYAQPGFGLTTTTPSPSPVSAGSAATATITLTSFNGYASPVNLTCAITGGASPLPCSVSDFSIDPVTPTASGAKTVLTITAPSASGTLLPTGKIDYAMWLPLVGLCLIGLIWPLAESTRQYGLIFATIAMAGVVLMLACGGSDNSPSGGGGSSATCMAAPSAPTGLAASSITGGSATLNWKPAGAGANCAVTGYTVYENGKSVGTSTTTTFNETGLSALTTYSFTVAASDSAGLSAQSSPVSVTTPGTYTVTITAVGTDANAMTRTVSTTLTVD
jgi:hypothetical protein